MDNNRAMKLIRQALDFNDKDVVRAVTLGGAEVSRHQARRWSRSRTAASSQQGSAGRGFAPMSDAHFEAFLLGLKPLMDEIEGDA